MSRIGYQETISIAAGQASAIHGFLDANLTTWSLGSIVTVETGDSNYEGAFFVLSHLTSPAELLVYVANAQYADAYRHIHSSGFYEGNNPTLADSDDLTFWIGSAPGGGFSDKLYVDSDNPANASFFDGYNPDFFHLVPFEGWLRGQPAQRLFAIEDDARAELTLYCVDDAGGNEYSGFIYSDEAYVQGPLIPPSQFCDPRGQIVIAYTNSNAPAERYYAAFLYPEGDGLREIWQMDNYDWNRGPSHIDDTTSPHPAGTIVAHHRVLDRPKGNSYNRKIRGEYNPDLCWVASRQSSLHKNVLTTPGGRKLAHIWLDMLTPWDESGSITPI